MKHVIRSFSLGLLTATALLAFSYYNTSNANEVTKEEAIATLEKEGFHVLSKQAYGELQKEGQKTSENIDTSDESNETVPEDSSSNEVLVYTLIISEGMLTSDISERLVEAGIIEDAQSFSSYLKEHDFSRSIQVGDYEVTSNMTFEEIANEITR